VFNIVFLITAVVLLYTWCIMFTDDTISSMSPFDRVHMTCYSFSMWNIIPCCIISEIQPDISQKLLCFPSAHMFDEGVCTEILPRSLASETTIGFPGSIIAWWW